jgi:hypothetical protein
MESERLANLAILCGILTATVDRARRDLRQIQAQAAECQARDRSGSPAPNDINSAMLVR